MAIESITSTNVKNQFGRMLEKALQGIPTIIERYNRPIAVLVNYDEYQRLKRAEADTLNRRSREVKEGNYVPWREVENALGD